MGVKSFDPVPVKQRVMDDSLRAIERALRGSSARPIIAYSGGKDGLAAAILCKQFDVSLGVCETSFCFTKQIRDIKRTARKLDFEVVYRDTLDMAWLARNQHVLFSRNGKDKDYFYGKRQRRSFEEYARDNGYNVIITGRKKDTNSVPSISYDVRGYRSVHPLREWSDGNVWWLLKEHGVEVPWVYGTAVGKLIGNGTWAAHRAHDDYPHHRQSWRDIFDIEPNIVRQAARHNLRGAQAFIRTVEDNSVG